MKPCNEIEEGIIREVIEYIKKKYNPKDSNLISISRECHKPHTPEWKEQFYSQNGKCGLGKNSQLSVPNRFKIYLTQCKDEVFYELVFHEVYECLFNRIHGNIITGRHEIIIPEQRKYIEEKFGIKLGCREWSPLEDEMVRTFYFSDKKRLENSLKCTGYKKTDRTWEEIEHRAKELKIN